MSELDAIAANGVFCLQDRANTVLITCETHRLDGPRKVNPHLHHSLELSCVLSGSGVYVVNDRFYDMRPGDVFLFNNTTDYHALLLKESESLCHLVLHFDPSFLWNALANDLDYNYLLVFFERGEAFENRLNRTNPATKRIGGLIQDIQEEFLNQQSCYPLFVKIKLQTIFAEIVRHYSYVDQSKAGRPLPQQEIDSMNQVMRYIGEHLDEDIRLYRLAAIAHVSPAYFSTLFKRFNGIPPIEYINHKRIQRAVEYIRTTDKSMTEIALDCGFNNSTNFYKAFRKFTGRTPMSYRQTSKKS